MCLSRSKRGRMRPGIFSVSEAVHTAGSFDKGFTRNVFESILKETLINPSLRSEAMTRQAVNQGFLK